MVYGPAIRSSPRKRTKRTEVIDENDEGDDDEEHNELHISTDDDDDQEIQPVSNEKLEQERATWNGKGLHYN